jgi:Arc/MetJ-type ribon-helix-helix transcriptional regulator
MYYISCYSRYMAERLISVRLDDEADDALRDLVAAGRTQSEAIREALIEAARRRRDRSLAAEVARLVGDEADRREAAEVAALMEALRAPR